MSNYEKVKAWRRRTKERLCKAFDSECGICGYNKSISALDFHHLNPSTKSFNIASQQKSWDKLVTEAKKYNLRWRG